MKKNYINNIKYIISMIAMISFCLNIFVGCKNNENTTTVNNFESTTVLESTTSNKITFDYDLAEMNATMFYSLLQNLIKTKNEQIGKTIRIKGEFNTFNSEKYNKRIFTCVVMDATMCCPLGVRLNFPKSLVYPDDYPTPGSIVTISGVLGIDKEYDEEYICINDVLVEKIETK